MVDIPGNASTDATITVGGTVDGSLETIGDHDWYRLQLSAGQSVTVILSGLTLEDTYLRIRDSSGNVVFQNDDISYPDNTDSRVSFTAPTSGAYYVDVGSFGDDYAGTYQLSVTTYTPPPVWTVDQVAEYLVDGAWDGQVHAFDAGPGDTITVNITALTADGQYLAQQALALWSDVTGINFVQVTTGGQITFDDNQPGAFSDAQWMGTVTTSAHVNISTQWLVEQGSEIGTYGFQTYIHEIGHALGLGHPGEYDGNADYYTDAQFANDGWPTTVMSYFSQEDGSYFPGQGYSFAYFGTPMIADIAAMQMLYGLSTTTRTGNTTYGFNSNSDRDVFNATLHPELAYTVFDSAGVDTVDYSGFSANQLIDLTAGSYSNVGGLVGNVAIANGTTIENAVGGSGNDILRGNSASNRLTGGGGADVLSGGTGSDTLIGGAGGDTFRGTAAELSGDTISDFTAGDRIVISNATLSSFTNSLSGSTLIYSGGSLTFGSAVTGTLVASTAAEGGVQLTLSSTPPPPAVIRAKLILTQSGQDAIVGGNLAVLGTTAGGEVIEIVRGDVTLDASFNAGGDTVVLPGNAGTYTAVLSGSFVTISAGGISVAIPVGTAGLAVQFADSTRTLEIESGQVVLGTQQITTTAQPVASSGAPLVDSAETGPDSFAKLILTAPGQDVDIGGNVSVTGTSSPGEVITVLGGNVRLDASFNAGGDTVVLPGASGNYSASLSGSFVTITDGEMSVAIPVGVNGLTVDFTDINLTLRIEGGQVLLGEQVITSAGGTVQAAAPLDAAKVDLDIGELGFTLEGLADGGESHFAPDADWGREADYNQSIVLHGFELSDSFSFA